MGPTPFEVFREQLANSPEAKSASEFLRWSEFKNCSHVALERKAAMRGAWGSWSCAACSPCIAIHQMATILSHKGK
ncbi:hypothetical protein CSHISOI_10460 [Colletotrichum shisoi]|uniref:Uncharacterized protein n=1 Tax=Colletotrichum shisoi TaxID=2078593 RepID=A0A5Q4BDX5_9PEZI|nr:hypothetical protein CSHISOI_10460 [Colletotrichum shisoi]